MYSYNYPKDFASKADAQAYAKTLQGWDGVEVRKYYYTPDDVVYRIHVRGKCGDAILRENDIIE